MRKFLAAGLFTVLIFLVCGSTEQSPDSPKSETLKDDQTMDARQILYTLPTICEKLPPLEKAGQLPQDAIRMHEDYWRQNGQTEPRGIVIYLGLEPPPDGNLTPEFTAFVSNLASSQKLFMVDWYKGQILPDVTAETLNTWAGNYKSSSKF